MNLLLLDTKQSVQQEAKYQHDIPIRWSLEIWTPQGVDILHVSVSEMRLFLIRVVLLPCMRLQCPSSVTLAPHSRSPFLVD